MQGFGWKRALVVVALVATCGTLAATAQARAGASGGSGRLHVQGRHRLFADGAARRLRGAVHPGAPVRARVGHEGHERDQRAEDRVDARGRRGRPREGRLGREGPDRQGVQDHRRQRLVGRRAPGRAPRRAEQGPLHLRSRGERRDHGDQQVHVPLRAAELPGRARRELVPRGRRREERDRLRAGLRVRPGQLPRRQAR